MNRPILLPAAVRGARPWRNGGGRTFTVFESRFRAERDDLDWRVSIAEIAAPGPFSPFPGMTRHFLPLAGRVRLAARAFTRDLGVDQDACTFSGDATIHAKPLSQSIRALNFMVRTGRFNGIIKRVAQGAFHATSDCVLIVSVENTTLTMKDDRSLLTAEDGLLIAKSADIRCDKPVILMEIAHS